MASEEFDAGVWVERLTGALTGLAQIQQHHWDEMRDRDELDELFTLSVRSPLGRKVYDPSWKFQRLYQSVTDGAPGFRKERHDPLRAALGEVRAILSGHPAWAEQLEASGDGQIWFEFPISAGQNRLLSVIAGLMARALEAGEDGFRVASSELALVLELDGIADRNPVREELLTGYHIVLFQGLMFSEETQIGDGQAIVPFGSLDAFFNADLLDRLMPGAARRQAEEFTAAIVKPFRWKPEFPADGPPSAFDKYDAGSFFEDADILIELLALFHATPAIPLVSLSPRVHRTACLLLGSMGDHRSFSGSRRSWMSGRMSRPVEARRNAIDAAVAAFSDRHGDRYRHCAPAMARLAEALARQGRFRNEDRILDVAVALERMYELDQGEISFKLKTRAACFLETETKNRLRVFKDVQELYDARSGIVHPRGRKRKKEKPREQLEQERRAAFNKGFDVARRSVVKLLKEEPPLDWNEMLLEAMEENPRGRRDGGKTTDPGHTNRNGQTVIRRTDAPGNDHNQVVYELECGGCGQRYGANGSDIWQRKCPKCGGGRPGLNYW